MNQETETREDKVPNKKIISFGFTSVVDSLIILMYQQTVFYFYEVEVGLSVALVGIAYVIFAIWNMINDPLVGYLTDKPKSWSKKVGVRKPWILIGLFMTALFFFLLYIPPDLNPTENGLIIFIYMIVVTCLFDLFYSLYTTHFQGGFANYFTDPTDRRKASAVVRVIGNIGRFTAAIFIIPFTIVYGDKSSFIRAGLIAVLVMFICAALFYPGIKETESLRERYIRSYEETEQISFFKMLKYAFKSKNYIINLVAVTMFTLSYSLYQGNFIYFFKDVLNLELTYQSVGSLLFFVGVVVSTPIWLKVAKKTGNSRVYVVSLVLSGVTFFIMSLQNEFIGYAITAPFIGLSMGGFLALLMVMVSDTMDEITACCGRHQEATLLGVSNFFLRISYLLTGAIIAIVHILTNYNPDPLAIQTPEAVWGVRMITGLLPLIFCIIGAVIFLIFYDLEGEKKERLLDEIRIKDL